MTQYKIVTTVEEGHGFRGSDILVETASTAAQRDTILAQNKSKWYAYQINVTNEDTGETVEYGSVGKCKWGRR